MPKEREFDVKITCRFCGNEWIDKWFTDKPQFWNMCANCSASDKRGAKVRYAAAVRSNEFGMADKVLTRGEIYTISKVYQWQHGRRLYFAETGNDSFDSMMFTKPDYEKFSERANAYAAIPNFCTVVGAGEVDYTTDLVWIAGAGFVPLFSDESKDPKDYELVIRQRMCLCGHPVNRHYQSICEAPSCACASIIEGGKNG